MLNNFLHQIFYNLEGFGLLLRAIFVIFVFLFMSYLCTRCDKLTKLEFSILDTEPEFLES
jgi:hypothetical protein